MQVLTLVGGEGREGVGEREEEWRGVEAMEGRGREGGVGERGKGNGKLMRERESRKEEKGRKREGEGEERVSL